MTEETTDAFEALDYYAEIVAVMSGVRTKFIEAGWSQVAAEMATMDMFRKSYSAEQG